MPSLANLANKELRFALLALFPSADLKLVSEAARCGDLDVASDFIRNALSECSTATAAAAAVSDPPSDPLPVEMPGKSTIGDAKEKAELASLPLAEPPPVSDFPDEAIDAASREVVKRKAARSGYDPARPAQGSLTADGWEIKCNVNLHKTCQSLRTLEYPTEKRSTAAETILRNVGTDNTAAFAAVCFERMMQREQEMDDDFCVFYHHYNSASLLYEVQAEIARHAFQLPDAFAPLPRIFSGHFKGVTIGKLKAAFETKDALSGQDHDPWFRSLAISASPTLFAFGSEAPPLSCFRQGYGCTDLSFQGLLTKMLEDALAVTTRTAAELCAKLAEVGASFGLQVQGYGHKGNSSIKRLGGQMLQIFIHKDHVAEHVYHCLAFGLPIATDVRPWLADPERAKKPLDGQVRILFDPELFVDGRGQPCRGQLFHYCGDWEFLGGDAEMEDSRAAFVLKIREVLAPYLEVKAPGALATRLRESRPPKAAPVTKARSAEASAPAAAPPPASKKKPRGRAK